MKTLFNLAILAMIFSASFLMLAKAWAEVRRAKRNHPNPYDRAD